MGIGGGEGDVVPRLAQGLVHHLGIQRAGVGEALPSLADDADAGPGGLGRGEGLDVALIDTNGRVAGPGDVHLQLLPGLGPGRHRLGQVEQLRHRRCLRW